MENWQQTNTSLANEQAKVAQAERALADLHEEHQELRKLQVAGQHPKITLGAKKVRSRDIQAIFNQIFPNIEVENESISFVAESVFSMKGLLPLLQHINDASKDDLPSKKIKGVNGWFECHFSTGQSHDGRIYFSWLPAGSKSRAKVLISKKATQEQDINRLQKL